IKKDRSETSNRSSWFSDLLLAFFEFLFSNTGRVLMWIVLAIVLLWILWIVFKNRGIYLFARAAGKLDQESVDAHADDFVPGDWADAIAQAEANQDYRLAVRHTYRHI